MQTLDSASHRTACQETAQLTVGMMASSRLKASQVPAYRFRHHGKMGEALLGGQEVYFSFSTNNTSMANHLDTLLWLMHFFHQIFENMTTDG